MKTTKKIRAKNTNAFTMIELILILIVIALLAALSVPRLERDIRQEAASNIVSALRYTKHMALIDNVMDLNRNNTWQRAFWTLGFQKCSDNGLFYYIASDKSQEGNIDANETFIDPANGLPMMGSNSAPCRYSTNNNASPNIFISKLYGITDPNGITLTCGSSGSTAKYIGFDRMGRPHRGYAGNSGSTTPDYSTVLHQDCNLTLHFDDPALDDVNITIEKITGRISYSL